MKTNNLRKKWHFINLRKLTKPTAVCISTIFILSVLLAFSSTAVQAATIPTEVAVSSASASSYDGSFTPNLAIDGIESTNNYWGTNALITTGKLPQWLQLDLGTQTSISQITTHFYDGDTRIYTYNIQVSTDGSSWTTVVTSKTGSRIVTDTFTQTTARYVRINITGNTANSAAHIVEIKIYQTPSNSGSQVTVSSASASSYDGSFTPNLAIDGIESTNNYWGTNALITTGKLPQWLQLDLGTQTSISQITTHFYDGDTRIYTYNIQVSTDGSSWTTVVTSKTGSRIVTDTFTQTTARYVRINITGNTANSAAHIVEIKIYQTPSNSGSQVTVSSASASSYDGSFTPNLAIDGIESTNNYWGTNALITTGKLPQWLQLDLGTQTSISQITTHFYDGDTRIYTYNIQVSTDGSSWTTVVTSKTGSRIVTDTFTQTTARYVRINITGNTANSAAHIVEIKIYQTPSNSGSQVTIDTNFLTINNGGFQLHGSAFTIRANNYDNALGVYLIDRSRTGYVDQALQECATYKFNTIRTWATGAGSQMNSVYSLWQSNPNELFKRFDEFIQICKDRNVHLIITLGVDEFFNRGGGNLGDSTSGSYAIYRNWVNQIAQRYRNEPQILFWEIFSEYEFCSQPADLVGTFNSNAASVIKSADPNHLLSTGSGNCGYSTSYWNLANGVAGVDIASIHVYSYEIQNMLGTNPSYQTIKTLLNDYAVRATSLGKMLFFGELGGDVGYDPNTGINTKPDNQQLIYSLRAISEIQGHYGFHSFASKSCTDKFAVVPSQNPQIMSALNQYN